MPTRLTVSAAGTSYSCSLLLLLLLLLLQLLVVVVATTATTATMTVCCLLLVTATGFDGIKQVIFEYNEIKPGGAAASWGDNVDTYAGGWAGHVWHAHNTFASVWMNDREYHLSIPLPMSNAYKTRIF